MGFIESELPPWAVRCRDRYSEERFYKSPGLPILDGRFRSCILVYQFLGVSCDYRYLCLDVPTKCLRAVFARVV